MASVLYSSLALCRRYIVHFTRLDRQRCYNSTYVKCQLQARSVIQLQGSDTVNLLQGLVTNDMKKIASLPGGSLYAFVLNVKGRVMYDLFIFNAARPEMPDLFLLDCDSSISDELIQFLKRYKIRKKVDIIPKADELQVSVIIPKLLSDSVPLDLQPSVIHTTDMRVPGFAHRFVIGGDGTGSLSDIPAAAEDEYTKRRYHWGIGEGVRDLPPGNCLPLESNIVLINGASFDKGCYLGQELTARTKFTGVVRKRLMPLSFKKNPGNITPDSELTTANGRNAGKYRHHVGEYGLGLVRLKEVATGHKLHVKTTNGDLVDVDVKVPEWWPEDCQEMMDSMAK